MNKIQEQVTLSHTLTTADRDLWHILLTHAAPEFYTQERHAIAVQELHSKWPYAHTHTELVAALRRLMVKVQFSFSRTQQAFTTGSFFLISAFTLSQDTCYYSYSKPLKLFSNYPIIIEFLQQYALYHYVLNHASIDHIPSTL